MDYGDSLLDLQEASEEPAQDGAGTQPIPAQVQARGQDGQSVPSQGTAHPTRLHIILLLKLESVQRQPSTLKQ